MDAQKKFGLFLLKKDQQDLRVLKDLLQLSKSQAPLKNHSFSYIEAETSLHPHLTLWENLKIEIGHRSWHEFQKDLKPEWNSLVKLIKNPEIKTQNSQTWERFLVSLLKGLILPTQNLLIDMNENLLSPFMIQQFKKAVLEATKEKNVYLASAHTSVWLDCAHSLVDKKEFKFEIELLDPDSIKRHWAA